MHPTINHTISHRQDIAPPLPPIVCLLQYQVMLQKTVRFGWELIFQHRFSRINFSIKLLFLFLARALWYWSPQTVFCAAFAATHSGSFQKKGSSKRTARIHQVLMMLQFFYSPFFQLTCCFNFLHAVCGIEAHRPSFALPFPPSTRVHFSRVAAQKEQWEKIKFWCMS